MIDLEGSNIDLAGSNIDLAGSNIDLEGQNIDRQAFAIDLQGLRNEIEAQKNELRGLEVMLSTFPMVREARRGRRHGCGMMGADRSRKAEAWGMRPGTAALTAMGSMASWDWGSGGVASLNHRLQAAIPPGWMGGCGRGRPRSQR